MSTLKSGFNLWLLLEKLIGIILLFWSGFVVYTMVSNIGDKFSSGYAATQNITVASIVAQTHFIIIISGLCIFGSCMLLFKDKTGWFLSVVSSFMFGVSLF